MSTDDQTLQDAADAVAVLMRQSEGRPIDRGSAIEVAAAALSVIPQAHMEEAPLYALPLERLSHDEAEFAIAGGTRVILAKGDWVERGRPSSLYVSILDLHPAQRP